MLHFDSHPDLAVSPTIDPDLVFTPRALYEALDVSSAGIAEWILPLVYGKHLTHVFWIKNVWSRQFENKRRYELFVVRQEKQGEEGGVMKVGSKDNLEIPYYIDDDSFIKLNQSQPQIDWSLSVNELNASGDEIDQALPSEISKTICATPGGWVLDICLDYFAVLNPFLADLPSNIGGAMLEVSTRVLFRSKPEVLTSLGDDDDPVMKARLEFEGLLSEFLTAASSSMNDNEVEQCDSAPLTKFYETSEIGEDLLNSIKDAIKGSADPEKYSKMCVDIIPVSMLPHCVCDSQFTAAFIEDEVEKVKNFLTSIKGGGAPGLVTIARSVEDVSCSLKSHLVTAKIAFI
jgi:hypothetical protein